MTAIILVWDPDEWNDWTYPAVLEEVAETGRHLASWDVGTSLDSGAGNAAGTDAWLVLQGRHGRGLIGHGIIVAERPAPRVQAPDSASAARTGVPAGAQADAQPGAQAPSPLYVQVDFDALLPAGDQIPTGVLAEAVPGIDWEALHGPALAVDPPSSPCSAASGVSLARCRLTPRSPCPAPSRRRRSPGSK